MISSITATSAAVPAKPTKLFRVTPVGRTPLRTDSARLAAAYSAQQKIHKNAAERDHAFRQKAAVAVVAAFNDDAARAE